MYGHERREERSREIVQASTQRSVMFGRNNFNKTDLLPALFDAPREKTSLEETEQGGREM